MDIKLVNRLLTFLLVYYVLLVLLSGLFGKHIEDDIARIFVLYGIPLLISIILFTVALGFEIHTFVKSSVINVKLLVPACIKMAVAVIPMFYLNNNLGYILSALRIN